MLASGNLQSRTSANVTISDANTVTIDSTYLIRTTLWKEIEGRLPRHAEPKDSAS